MSINGNNDDLDNKIKYELKELLKVPEVPKDKCWLDGSRCPYGVPEGQFSLRPLNFCRVVPPGIPKQTGCPKLKDSADQLVEIISDYESDQRCQELKKLVSDEQTTLDGEVEALIDKISEGEYGKNTEKFRGALRIAVLLLKKHISEENRQIIHVNRIV